MMDNPVSSQTRVMSSYIVPPAPAASWESPNVTPGTPAQMVEHGMDNTMPAAPLDAAFLARSYRSILWSGALMTVLLALGLWSKTSLAMPIAASFGGGVMLATLLLKSQELFVRRIVRPRDVETGSKLPYNGPDKFVPLPLLLSIKYLLVTAFIGCGLREHWILAIPFATGFGVVQLVITARAIGRILQARVGTVRTAYIEKHHRHA